jgi:hypothetical protein
VQLDMLQGLAMSIQEPLQSPHLVYDVIDQIHFRHIHEPAPESNLVRITGMGSRHNPVGFAEPNSFVHDGGIRGVKAAGDIGGRNVVNNDIIRTDTIFTKGLSHITIEIDHSFHHITSK